MYKFYGIGVGVGSSDIVTKRAVDVLGNLRILYVPKAKKVGGRSEALTIAEPYISPNITIKERYFPMNYNSDELQKAWDAIANEIMQDVLSGQDVGFVTIGDPLIYSTYIYLMRLVQSKVKVETIAGIPSFLDIASNHNFPLVEGDDPLLVLPATMPIDQLERYLEKETSMVLMKVFKNPKEIVDLIEKHGLLDCSIAVSNSSKSQEIVYEDVRLLREGETSYFTTILINRNYNRHQGLSLLCKGDQ